MTAADWIWLAVIVVQLFALGVYVSMLRGHLYEYADPIVQRIVRPRGKR